MKLAAKKTPPNSSARVVDGKLILSYPEAINPVVWQMDLSQAKASALEVSQNAKGQSVLTLKTAKGEAVDIAPFATKEEAVSALMAAAHALENAQGHIRPLGIAHQNGTTALNTHTKEQKSFWAASILGALLIVILIMIWGALNARPPASSEPLASTTKSFGQQDENGVPLSADEFLLKHKPQQ